ncbi:MAG TPA: biopolymer transporter ExbD [Rhizomicrobium sp.]|jgi:biopolymer transport protein ExbD|nr:biopolymer transporter ExbD [Rhizomicrobium sp.]
MSINVHSADGDEAELNTTINTTPLVDVMLVLLIIFLITIPVALKLVPVQLPDARNIPTQTKPENLVIAVTTDESVYVNNVPVSDNNDLLHILEQAAVKVPQPEIHIRGDKGVRFEAIGRIITDCQRAGIQKVGFITEPRNEAQ